MDEDKAPEGRRRPRYTDKPECFREMFVLPFVRMLVIVLVHLDFDLALIL